MRILKNTASQKVGFVMVDKTDFATPETGITVSGTVRKDGGASAAIANTVSELTEGQYVLTLTDSETDADLVQLRFHDSGASCATQFITFHTDQGKIVSILADTGDITTILTDTSSTLDNKIDSILADTQTLSNATYGLDALETIVSNIESTLDDMIGSQIASILTDTGTIATVLTDTSSTLDNKIDSILADTQTLSNATYGLDALETIASQIKSTIDDPVTDYLSSILADTITLSNATYGLDALETITSQTKSTIDNATFGLDAIETIASDILSTLDDVVGSQIASILTDTGTIATVLTDTSSTLDNKIDSVLADTTDIQDNWSAVVSATSNIQSIVAVLGGDSDKITSILADTKTLSNATYGLDALETIASDILSTLDDVVGSQIASILTDTGTIATVLTDTSSTLDNKIDSILADTQTLSNATYGLDALETICSDVLEALDSAVAGPIASILADTITLSNATYGLDALETITSQTKSTLDNATFGLDALETITSQVKSTIDAPITDFLTSIVDDTSKIHSTIDGVLDSAVTQNTGLISDILSTIDGPVISAISSIEAVTDALTAAAATKLATSAGTMVIGTVSHDNTAASTTVIYSDDITEATADHYNGRIMIFTSGDLQYQATDITDYALDTGEGKFTVTALTEAPADNVTFIIV